MQISAFEIEMSAFNYRYLYLDLQNSCWMCQEPNFKYNFATHKFSMM